MNILFYCNEYPPYVVGGIGVFTKGLAEHLVRNGHKVYVVGTYDQKQIEQINGVTVFREEKSSVLFFNRIKSYFLIKKIIKNYKIDVLEVQDFQGLLAFFPKFKCKIVTRLHGSVSYFYSILNLNKSKLKKAVWYILEKNSILKSDKIVSCSNYTAELTKKIFNITNQIEVIYNGVSSGNLNPSDSIWQDNEPKTYLFYGSLIDKKGIFELVEAWNLFCKGRNVRLDIYGKDIEGAISKLSSFIDNNDTIFVHDPISNSELQRIIAKVNFCIFPTKAEAFSLAPMEAMAQKKVVIYNDQTSAKELITDNYNGLLIDSCSVIDIKSALERSYCLSRSEYYSLSCNAYNTINTEFNLNKINNHNMLMYLNLL